MIDKHHLSNSFINLLNDSYFGMSLMMNAIRFFFKNFISDLTLKLTYYDFVTILQIFVLRERSLWTIYLQINILCGLQ